MVTITQNKTFINLEELILNFSYILEQIQIGVDFYLVNKNNEPLCKISSSKDDHALILYHQLLQSGQILGNQFLTKQGFSQEEVTEEQFCELLEAL